MQPLLLLLSLALPSWRRRLLRTKLRSRIYDWSGNISPINRCMLTMKRFAKDTYLYKVHFTKLLSCLSGEKMDFKTESRC